MRFRLASGTTKPTDVPRLRRLDQAHEAGLHQPQILRTRRQGTLQEDGRQTSERAEQDPLHIAGHRRPNTSFDTCE